MIRLNLAENHCTLLQLTAFFELPEAAGETLMSSSSVMTTGENTPTLAFGSRYTVRGQPHVVAAGTIRDDESGTFFLFVSYAPIDMEITPRSIKSVDRLFDLLSDNVGTITFNCTATFSHKISEGYESIIPLPFQLFPTSKNPTVTHIEQMVLSKRNADAVEYTIQVQLDSANDALIHRVELEVESRPSRSMPEQVFSKAVDIVSQLVNHQGGVFDDPFQTRNEDR